jgi:hypothetical protein
VKKEHVDWASTFLVSCYDNEVFRLREYAERTRKMNSTNEEINTEVIKIMKKYPVIIKLLLEQEECPHYNLKVASGIGDDEYKFLSSNMFTKGLVKATTKGFAATKRLKLAVNAHQNKIEKPTFQPMNDEPKSFSDKINLN